MTNIADGALSISTFLVLNQFLKTFKEVASGISSESTIQTFGPIFDTISTLKWVTLMFLAARYLFEKKKHFYNFGCKIVLVLRLVQYFVRICIVCYFLLKFRSQILCADIQFVILAYVSFLIFYVFIIFFYKYYYTTQ